MDESQEVDDCQRWEGNGQGYLSTDSTLCITPDRMSRSVSVFSRSRRSALDRSLIPHISREIHISARYFWLYNVFVVRILLELTAPSS